MCKSEEADQKLVRHMIQCVVIKTVDTDVLVILIACRHYAAHLESNVYTYFGTGNNIGFYDINAITLMLGEKTVHALPFVHAFSGCDSVSAFFNQGKCKLWDIWQDFEDNVALTHYFCELSNMPPLATEEQISILEKFILFVY